MDRLYSIESAEGSIGSDGVAATGFPGVLLIAQGEGTPDALAEPGIETADPAAETQEHLLLSVDGGSSRGWTSARRRRGSTPTGTTSPTATRTR